MDTGVEIAAVTPIASRARAATQRRRYRNAHPPHPSRRDCPSAAVTRTTTPITTIISRPWYPPDFLRERVIITIITTYHLTLADQAPPQEAVTRPGRPPLRRPLLPAGSPHTPTQPPPPAPHNQVNAAGVLSHFPPSPRAPRAPPEDSPSGYCGRRRVRIPAPTPGRVAPRRGGQGLSGAVAAVPVAAAHDGILVEA